MVGQSFPGRASDKVGHLSELGASLWEALLDLISSWAEAAVSLWLIPQHPHCGEATEPVTSQDTVRANTLHLGQHSWEGR